jgi:hypothetical protein
MSENINLTILTNDDLNKLYDCIGEEMTRRISQEINEKEKKILAIKEDKNFLWGHSRFGTLWDLFPHILIHYVKKEKKISDHSFLQ